MNDRGFRAESGGLVWEQAGDRYERPFHCPGARANFLASLRAAWMMRAEHVVHPRHLKLGECQPRLATAPNRFVPLGDLPHCRTVDEGCSIRDESRYRDGLYVNVLNAWSRGCSASVPGCRTGW